MTSCLYKFTRVVEAYQLGSSEIPPNWVQAAVAKGTIVEDSEFFGALGLGKRCYRVLGMGKWLVCFEGDYIVKFPCDLGSEGSYRIYAKDDFDRLFTPHEEA